MDVVKEEDEGVLKEEVKEFFVVVLVMDEGQEQVMGQGVKRKKNTPSFARECRPLGSQNALAASRNRRSWCALQKYCLLAWQPG